MKKVLIIVLAAVGFAACDKVENPNQNPHVVAQCTGTYITKTNTVVGSPNWCGFKKVLVEDYTGQKCGNCPPAATTAEGLEVQYKDSLIALAVHAGGFANPGAAPYTTDFRTSAGTAWDGGSGFGISVGAGNPNGMVNRKDFPTNTHIKPYSTWGSIVSSLAPFGKTPDVRLDVVTGYDATQRLLYIKVKSTFNKAYTADVKLNVLLSEDSIIGTQKDYSKVPVDVYPYVFMNLNRGSFNGDWGDVIKTAPVIGDTITKMYPCNIIHAQYNDKNLSVVVFAYDNSTKEIIQVEKVKIK